MLLPTPFDARTGPLNVTQEWRDWVGYRGAAVYGPSIEPEYWAVRNAVGLLDASPLFKYEVRGPAAVAALDRIVTRDVASMAVGQVGYTLWCDDRGKVVDDGTLSRLGDDHFRLTAAEPSLRWLQDGAFGLDVTIEDVSSSLAALALQGPRSRALLEMVATPPERVASLKYFRLCEVEIADASVTITRTGYTGDLGYELWLHPDDALTVWDALVAGGRSHGLRPLGLAALDVLRVEAGLVMLDVDYTSSERALTSAQTSSPYELDLAWTVGRNKDGFIGGDALAVEQRRKPTWRLVGIDVSWPALEAMFNEVSLPPQVTGRVTRGKTPLYRGGSQIGYATSVVFSPLLKRYIGLATVSAEHAAVGSPLELEVTVERQRLRAPATVVRTPFFDPERKRA